jgi:hypothetical protein
VRHRDFVKASRVTMLSTQGTMALHVPQDARSRKGERVSQDAGEVVDGDHDGQDAVAG